MYKILLHENKMLRNAIKDLQHEISVLKGCEVVEEIVSLPVLEEAIIEEVVIEDIPEVVKEDIPEVVKEEPIIEEIPEVVVEEDIFEPEPEVIEPEIIIEECVPVLIVDTIVETIVESIAYDEALIKGIEQITEEDLKPVRYKCVKCGYKFNCLYCKNSHNTVKINM